MILTKQAHLRYFTYTFESRLNSYKRFRTPKYARPYSILISFVAGVGELISDGELISNNENYVD